MKNSLKQLKIASTNRTWAYIREGLLSEGFLRLRFGGLIFGRAYLFIISESYSTVSNIITYSYF